LRLDEVWEGRQMPLRTVRPDDFWLVTASVDGFGLVGLLTDGFVAFKRGERFQ